MTKTTETESLLEQLRDCSHGIDEWRVQDPEGRAFCMAFSCGDHLDGYSLHPERDAREWLEDHKKRFPGSPKASYVVAKVRRRTQAEELMQEAADEIERLRKLVQNAVPVVAEQSDQFYVQDSRSTVGNDMLWWCPEGNGYTTDIRKAGVFTREDAQRMHDHRPTDIPWPKSYIDAKTRPAVDVQYVRREEALAGTGIVLAKPEREKREVLKCESCGSFMSHEQLWGGVCPKCGADNRP